MMDAERLAKIAGDHDVPGAVLAVLVDDEVQEHAVGIINQATGVSVTADTLFQIGSVTKVWTTTLLMLLADDGKVDLDAPVRTYVPELKLVDEAAAEAITVKHLLNHTSGLPGDYFPDTGRGDDCLERYLNVLANAELTHPPGAFFSYSNAALVLAGLIVERLEMTTWDGALQRRLVEPLGLTKTVTLPEDALLHRCAVGHLGSGSSQRVTPTWMLPRNCGPAGGICAPGRDVLEFARLHLTGGLTRSGERLVSEQSINTMQEVTVGIPGANAPQTGIGLGWVLGRWAGTRVLQHDGGTLGQAAALRVLPDLGIAVVLAGNGGTWLPFRDAVLGEVIPEITQMKAPDPPVPPTPPQVPLEVADYVGTYRNIGAEATITDHNGELQLSLHMLDPLEALATGENLTLDLKAHGRDSFLAHQPDKAPQMAVHFIRDANGRVEYLHAGGRAARRL